MSYGGRKKHTQALLMSMQEKIKNEAAGGETVRTDRFALATSSCSVRCRAARHCPGNRWLGTLPSPCLPPPSPLWMSRQAATALAEATSESKKKKSATKQWLPAYLSEDRHEASELVAMVQSRRKDDGTFFTGS